MKKMLLMSLFAVCSNRWAYAADPSYSVKVDASPVKVGQKGAAHLQITPGAGFHMNKDYPTSLTLKPPAGVTIEKAKMNAKDAAKFAEAGAEFQIPLTVTEAGKKTVTGELKFAVCSATSCDPKKETISFDVVGN